MYKDAEEIKTDGTFPDLFALKLVNSIIYEPKAHTKNNDVINPQFPKV